MTLVARIMFKGAPIYIGDMLLSSEGASDKSVDIPAARDISAWLPPMTVMHVPQGPRHPKAPANEEEAWRDPHQKHGEERLHGRCLSTP